MSDLPGGTLTFLFTDIEGSSARWERHHVAMRDALRRHDAIVRSTIEKHGGIVFEAAGDAFHAVFERAHDAAVAAHDVRTQLDAETWTAVDDLPVRIALHAGSANAAGGRYVGASIDAIKALVALCNGGQTVVSQSVAMLLASTLPTELSLTSIGSLQLEGERLTEIFQLDSAGKRTRFPAFRDPSQPATNLPRQFTSFVGRTTELAEMRSLLAESRVLTLCGPGGVGKSRTALALASEELQNWSDGVWFVPFAAIGDPGRLAEAAASALALGERHAKTACETLVEHLTKRRALLVFDNCEHVVEAASHLVSDIEHACPNVKIVATSREALRTPGERVYSLQPLAVNANFDRLPSIDSLEDSPAVALFLERARIVSQGVRYAAPERREIARLCMHLDGLPLAIELAAARSNVYPPSVLVDLIGRRFELLPPLAAGGTSPHRTLRGLVAWSYDLLSEQEQILFRRLAIFSGGWTVEAAEIVTSGSGLDSRDIFGLLANLFDKSLLQRPGDFGERFSFLETIRAYAVEMLEQSGELETMRRAHVEYFAMLTSHAEPSLRTSGQDVWLERLTIDADNVRTALDTGDANPALAKPAMLICANLARYWIILGSLREGSTRLRWALEHAEMEPKSLVRALTGAAIIALNQRMGEDFLSYAERARTAARDTDDAWTRAYAAVVYAAAMAYTMTSPETFAARDTAIREARRLAEGTADAWLYNHLDHAEIFCAETSGNFVIAAALEEIALEHAETSGDRILIISSSTYVAYRARSTNPMRSARLLQRASSMLAGSHVQGLALILECAVILAFEARLFELSANFMGAANANRLQSMSQGFRVDPDAHKTSLKRSLDGLRFGQLFREGSEWSFSKAVHALGELPDLLTQINRHVQD